MRDKYYGYKHSLRQYAAILYRTYPPGFAIFLVRVRVRVGVRVRVRVRVRVIVRVRLGFGLGLSLGFGLGSGSGSRYTMLLPCRGETRHEGPRTPGQGEFIESNEGMK